MRTLAEKGIPGISGIDTRALTKHLRVAGALQGVLTTENLSDKEAIERAKAWSYEGQDFVDEVTCKEAYDWDPDGTQSR